MDRWRGRVAVVTGASSGIGAETVKALAGKGVIVVALARREEKLKEVFADVAGTIHSVKCDVTKENEVVDTFDWIQKTLGGVDILVNNAGVLKLSSLMADSTDAWRTVMETNVIALSVCTREALKTMRTRGDDGHIIHINSISGHTVPQFNIPLGMYPASKFAVTALTESMRVELLHANSKIKVTSISPGTVRTEMTRDFIPSEEEAASTPRAYLVPSDISEAILYILATKPGVQVHELTIQPIGQKLG